MRQLSEGIQAYFWALRQISRGKVFYNILITGFISLTLGALLFLFAYNIADDMGNYLLGFYKWDFGKSFFSKLFNFLGGTSVAIIGLLLYKYVIMIVVSPFMSPLSERLERELNDGVKISGGEMKHSSAIVRGIRITIRNIWKEISLTLLLLILSLVPSFAIVTGPLIFIVQAYYAGFGNMDYTLERHMNVKAASRFVKGHKISAITNGAIFLALLFIPVIGLFLAPTLAAAAATKVTTQRIKRII